MPLLLCGNNFRFSMFHIIIHITETLRNIMLELKIINYTTYAKFAKTNVFEKKIEDHVIVIM